MDIINLIELLKPQDHLVTVRVSTEASFWPEVGKFIIALLPAAISLFALFFSYLQFKENIKNQTFQFIENTNHQIKIAELNAKLNTEIDLIKNRCDSVRKISVQCIELATAVFEGFAVGRDYDEVYDEQIKKTEPIRKKILANSEKRIANFDKLISEQAMLMTYLDNDDDKLFIKSLDNLCDFKSLSKVDVKVMARLRGEFLMQCREYLKKKDREIIEMAKLSTNN